MSFSMGSRLKSDLFKSLDRRGHHIKVQEVLCMQNVLDLVLKWLGERALLENCCHLEEFVL